MDNNNTYSLKYVNKQSRCLSPLLAQYGISVWLGDKASNQVPKDKPFNSIVADDLKNLVNASAQTSTAAR